MKFLLGIPILFLFLAGIVLLVVVSYVYRFWMKITKHIRGDFSDEEIERLSKKYYKQARTYNFDKDYFKRGEDESYQRSQASAQQASTHTDAASGVTIIDDRSPEVASRKIFNKDEGEYVDYKEA